MIRGLLFTDYQLWLSFKDINSQIDLRFQDLGQIDFLNSQLFQDIDFCFFVVDENSYNTRQIVEKFKAFSYTENILIFIIDKNFSNRRYVDLLNLGVDDVFPYISNQLGTFEDDLRAISLRIMAFQNALKRRGDKNLNIQQVYTFGEFKLDLSENIVWINNIETDLTFAEFKILYSLLANPGKVLSREKILEQIQNKKSNVTKRIVDTHIVELRKKLGDHSKNIKTIRGLGYKYTA
ncbi:MAG: response regulator transcription factor [Halobacteriovoraceae bacterium]|nr:response regulator transcription factor [Halobacteriovoraceae bacterium]